MAYIHGSDFDFQLSSCFTLGHDMVGPAYLVLTCKDKPEYNTKKKGTNMKRKFLILYILTVINLGSMA